MQRKAKSKMATAAILKRNQVLVAVKLVKLCNAGLWKNNRLRRSPSPSCCMLPLNS